MFWYITMKRGDTSVKYSVKWSHSERRVKYRKKKLFQDKDDEKEIRREERDETWVLGYCIWAADVSNTIAVKVRC